MEYMTPNFTKDMVKTHKILIPNMAVTQFRLLQAALECEGLLPPKHDAGPQPDIIEHFGNADAVPQPPERCLSRKAGIVRCCLRS